MSPNGTDDDGDDLAAPRPTMNGTQRRVGTDEIEEVDPTKERKLLARRVLLVEGHHSRQGRLDRLTLVRQGWGNSRRHGYDGHFFRLCFSRPKLDACHHQPHSTVDIKVYAVISCPPILLVGLVSGLLLASVRDALFRCSTICTNATQPSPAQPSRAMDNT